jgi:hypothetical protein
MGSNGINALALVCTVVASIPAELTPAKRFLKALPAYSGIAAQALEMGCIFVA